MKITKLIPIKYILIIVTIIAVVTIIVTFKPRSEVSAVEKGLGYVIIPIQKVFTGLEDWVVDKINFVKNINKLEEQNEQLLVQVDQLSYENKLLQQYKKDNDRLRELLELDKKYSDYPKVGAQVIGKEPGNWYNIFLIDKGAKDGLTADMVVMAGNGLVGRIIDVGANYSKVVSIIDDTSSVSSKSIRTSDTGIVRGDLTLMNEGLCKMENIDAEATIIKGDEIVTSHLGDIYPPGILIGTIKEIKKESHGLTKYAYIEPAVDFKHIEEVLVITQTWKKEEK